MEKVQLPETGFFYELAMRRSAEIKGVAIQPTKKARPPVSKCPKCGAEAANIRSATFVAYRCETKLRTGGRIVQSYQCRIRELTAENERLRAELSERKSKMTFEEWEKMNKDFGESLSDC